MQLARSFLIFDEDGVLGYDDLLQWEADISKELRELIEQNHVLYQCGQRSVDGQIVVPAGQTIPVDKAWFDDLYVAFGDLPTTLDPIESVQVSMEPACSAAMFTPIDYTDQLFTEIGGSDIIHSPIGPLNLAFTVAEDEVDDSNAIPVQIKASAFLNVIPLVGGQGLLYEAPEVLKEKLPRRKAKAPDKAKDPGWDFSPHIPPAPQAAPAPAWTPPPLPVPKAAPVWTKERLTEELMAGNIDADTFRKEMRRLEAPDPVAPPKPKAPAPKPQDADTVLRETRSTLGSMFKF